MTIERTRRYRRCTCAVCGNSSLTSIPDSPCRRNFHGDASKFRCWPRYSFGAGRPSFLAQARLGIERIDLRWAAGHEQEDDPLGPRGKMRRFAQLADLASVAGLSAGGTGTATRQSAVPPARAHRIRPRIRRSSSRRFMISIDIDKLVRAQHHMAVSGPGLVRSAGSARNCNRFRSPPASADGPRRSRTVDRSVPRRAAWRVSRAITLGQCRGQVDHKRIIHQKQRLRGDDRIDPLFDNRRRNRAHRITDRSRPSWPRCAPTSDTGCVAASRHPESWPSGVVSRRPATASRLSRIASASSRRRFIRDSRRFSGSAASALRDRRVLC